MKHLKAEIAVQGTNFTVTLFYIHIAKLEMWIKSIRMISKLSPYCSSSFKNSFVFAMLRFYLNDHLNKIISTVNNVQALSEQ